MIMNINSNTFKCFLNTTPRNCYLLISYMQIKKRNVKRKNVQSGRAAVVIACKTFLNKYFICSRI